MFMALITGLIGFSFTVATAGLSAAQSVDMGARGLALANAAVAAAQFPYEPVNPAGRFDDRSAALSFSFAQAHGLPELRHVAAVARYPLSAAALAGLTVESFGFDAYRRLTASAVFSTRLASRMRIGLRTTLRRVAIAGYGNRSAAGISAGWITALSKNVCAGGSWRYIGAPPDYRGRLLPQELDFGFEARASPTVRLLAAMARESGTDADMRFGAEVLLAEPLVLRVGSGTHPDRIALGLGLIAQPVSIDAAVSIHRTLGPSFAVSVSLE